MELCSGLCGSLDGRGFGGRMGTCIWYTCMAESLLLHCETINTWFIYLLYSNPGASLVAHIVKNLPAIQKTQVQFLGLEDPLEKMATHSSIIAWKIPWTEEPHGLQSMGSQGVKHDQSDNTSLSFAPVQNKKFIYIYIHTHTFKKNVLLKCVSESSQSALTLGEGKRGLFAQNSPLACGRACSVTSVMSDSL